MFSIICVSLFSIIFSIASSNPIPDNNSFNQIDLFEMKSFNSEPAFTAEKIRNCIASGKNYCEIQYSNEYKKSIKQLLGNETMNSFQKPSSIDNSMCATTKVIVHPTFAQDETGEWIHVVNQDQLRQSIEIEICLSAILPNYFNNLELLSRRDELVPLCVSFNRTFQLYSLVNNTIQVKNFSFPSVCSVGLYATFD